MGSSGDGENVLPRRVVSARTSQLEPISVGTLLAGESRRTSSASLASPARPAVAPAALGDGDPARWSNRRDALVSDADEALAEDER